MKRKEKLAVFLVLLCFLGIQMLAQQSSGIPGSTPVQLANPYYALVPISATAAVNTQTTLTIPAPPAGYYNYVCDLKYQVNNDNTGTVLTNVVSTSTNFNGFAVKFSATSTASIDSGAQQVLGPFNPAFGCPKSAQAGVATTFVSPASVTHSAWSWYSTYYQAP